MDVLTPEDIRKYMQVIGQEKIASDGWAGIGFAEAVTDVGDNGDRVFTPHLETRYVLSLNCRYVVPYGASDAEHEAHKIRIAHQLHRELYGRLENELEKLKWKMRAAPKAECEELLDGILKQITGRG